MKLVKSVFVLIDYNKVSNNDKCSVLLGGKAITSFQEILQWSRKAHLQIVV